MRNKAVGFVERVCICITFGSLELKMEHRYKVMFFVSFLFLFCNPAALHNASPGALSRHSSAPSRIPQRAAGWPTLGGKPKKPLQFPWLLHLTRDSILYITPRAPGSPCSQSASQRLDRPPVALSSPPAVRLLFLAASKEYQ